MKLTIESADAVRAEKLQEDLRQLGYELRAEEVADNGSHVLHLVLSDDGANRSADEGETQRAKLESLTTLANGIAHDFNNLLAAILGNVELALIEAGSSSSLRENLEQVQRASRHAAELIRQLLTYTGRASGEFRAVSLNELVRDMTELLRVSIGRRASFQLFFGDKLPSFSADPTQIRQIVMNLLINASEAMPEEGGVIIVRTTEKRITANEVGRYLPAGVVAPGLHIALEVQDNGCGMDAETRARIFDPFFTTKRKGRGLGLAGVMGIVRAHGGGITVESELGRGSLFRVLFPLRDREEVVSPDSVEKKLPGAY